MTNEEAKRRIAKHCQFCGQAVDWGEEAQNHAT